MESWSIKDVKDWIKFSGLGSFAFIIDKYNIDGDGILVIDEAFFESVRNYSKQPQAFISLLQNRQKEEMEKQLNYVLPPPDMDEIFPPHKIPADPLQAVMFYHTETYNTRTGGARSVKRDWTQQPQYNSAPTYINVLQSLATILWMWKYHPSNPNNIWGTFLTQRNIT